MAKRRGLFRLSAGLISVCLLAMLAMLAMLAAGGAAFAQGAAPIQIGQNATGTLTADAPTAQFALTANAGDTVAIQVLAISAGFRPNFQILNAAGVQILNVANPDGKATLTGNAAFDDAGVYTIVVGGENGSTGQFVLSLQPGAPLPQPITLTVEQPITAAVGSQSPVLIYGFDTTSLGAVTLHVASQTAGSGVLVTLYDATLSKTIASSDAGVIGAAYQLPAAGKLYRVEVRAAGSTDTAFSICVGTCGEGGALPGNSAASPTPDIVVVPPPAVTPEAVAAGCTATSSAGGSVNLRSGPGTNYAVLSTLPLGQTVTVLAEWTGGGWYEVNFNGLVLWVGGSVVSLSGDCTALPRIAAPTNAQLAPTKVAPPVNTPEVEPSEPSQQALPNLTTTNIQISNPGDGTLNIDITVINAGTAPVDSPYAVKTCLDTTNCNEITDFAAGLQPGDTMSFTDSVPFDGSAGNHTVLVTVDSQHQVTESNESDNDGFASFNS